MNQKKTNILQEIRNINQSILIAYERKDWGYILEINKHLLNLEKELKNEFKK
jgi:hypothetical protein